MRLQICDNCKSTHGHKTDKALGIKTSLSCSTCIGKFSFELSEHAQWLETSHSSA